VNASIFNSMKAEQYMLRFHIVYTTNILERHGGGGGRKVTSAQEFHLSMPQIYSVAICILGAQEIKFNIVILYHLFTRQVIYFVISIANVFIFCSLICSFL